MTERDSITSQERYFGAKNTAIVLKIFAYIYFFAGMGVVAYTVGHYKHNGGSGRSLLMVIAIEATATLLGAAMLFFFAYVLDLLRGIWEETAGEND